MKPAALGAALCAALLVACAEEPAPPPALPALPTFELREVVQPRIVALEKEVAALDAAERASWGTAPEDLAEQAAGLVTFLMSAKGAMVDAAFEDAQRLGPHAIEPLVERYREEGVPVDERRTILRLLGEYDVPDAARFFAEVAGSDPEPLLRSTASWKLAGLGQDLAVPALLRQLKYEKDDEAVAWLARALAAQGNFAGLAPLGVLVGRQGTEGSANVALWEIAANAGYANPFDLRVAWEGGDPALRRDERSPGFELAVWNWIFVFTEFQLRGVDDGRYVLTDLGQESAAGIAAALHDSNRYIRVHVAQSLGRMARRGEDAASELAQALGDPILAPYAAQALAEVCSTRHVKRAPTFDAYPPLASAALPGRDPSLQLSALRALGVLGDARALETLRTFATPDAAPPEFRQAALEGLLLSSDLVADEGELHQHLKALSVQCLDPYVDAGSSLRAMLDWLRREHAAVAPPYLAPGEVAPEQPPADAARFALFDEALTRWNAWAPNPYVPPPVEENVARTAARLAIVTALVDALEAGAAELGATPEPPRDFGGNANAAPGRFTPEGETLSADTDTTGDGR